MNNNSLVGQGFYELNEDEMNHLVGGASHPAATPATISAISVSAAKWSGAIISGAAVSWGIGWATSAWSKCR